MAGQEGGARGSHPILDAAQRLVLERGFAGTSVDAVLAAASVTKGGFFHHFPSKQALGLASSSATRRSTFRRSRTS